MQEIDRLFKLAAGGDYETILALLIAAQDRAADIRTTLSDAASGHNEYELRSGAVAILTTMIDKLRSARKTLEQRPGGLNTEGE